MQSSALSQTKSTILLTGASTGLGLALSKLLLTTTSYRLVLTARESSLPRFAEAGIFPQPHVWLRPLDVTDAEQRNRLILEIDEQWGGVDILINNAGIAYRSVVEHVGEEERRAQMDINFLSPMELVRLVLPGMRAKQNGRIINVSSVGGMMAMPTMAIYSASKFALEGATEALWYEVRPWNVRVSLIEPGFIHSSSFENTRYTRASQASVQHIDEAYHAHYEYMSAFIARLMSWTVTTPERVAQKILATIRHKHPQLRVQATFDAHVFSFLRRVLPCRLYHQILYWSLPHVRRWGPKRP